MIAKAPFVKGLNAILERRKQYNKIKDGIEAFGINLCADPLEDVLVDTLDAALDLDVPPQNGWVSWWLYDCSLCHSSGKPASTNLNGKEYQIATPEELYDFCLKYKEA